MSTSGRYHDTCGGYHEYIGEYSVHWGFQYKSKAFLNLVPHMNHDIARCTQDSPPPPPPPDVLMVTPDVLNTHIIQGDNNGI